MEENFNKHHSAKENVFKCNDPVFVKVYQHNKWHWSPGTILQNRGKVTYNVKINNGKILHAHANQLNKRFINKNAIHHEEMPQPVRIPLDYRTNDR